MQKLLFKGLKSHKVTLLLRLQISVAYCQLFPQKKVKRLNGKKSDLSMYQNYQNKKMGL